MTQGPYTDLSGGPQFPPPPPPLVAGPSFGPGGPRRPHGRGVWSTVATILLILSVFANVALFVLLILAISLAGGLGGTQGDGLREHVITKGQTREKIAVIHIDGVLDDLMVEDGHKQIMRAAEDPRVKAVILEINSPGGGLTASDSLHHLLQTELEGKPIVAAMDAVAASGGYYIACAAQRIVAQPTTVTGSIGIIGHLFFVNELMKDKLGIVPVTIKVGAQKDWPNMFTQAGLPDEQRQYLMDALMTPGFDRFVQVVREARGFDEAEVRRLATGRVFTGPEARDVNLVDEVGYFERAVEIAEELGGAQGATVVEYQRVPTLADFLSLQTEARQALNLTPERIAAMATPRVMYLWTGQ